jgi:hypothetical protein
MATMAYVKWFNQYCCTQSSGESFSAIILQYSVYYLLSNNSEVSRYNSHIYHNLCTRKCNSPTNINFSNWNIWTILKGYPSELWIRSNSATNQEETKQSFTMLELEIKSRL